MTTLSDRLVVYLDHRRRFGYRRIGTTAAVLRRFAAFADVIGLIPSIGPHHARTSS